MENHANLGRDSGFSLVNLLPDFSEIVPYSSFNFQSICVGNKVFLPKHMMQIEEAIIDSGDNTLKSSNFVRSRASRN